MAAWTKAGLPSSVLDAANTHSHATHSSSSSTASQIHTASASTSSSSRSGARPSSSSTSSSSDRETRPAGRSSNGRNSRRSDGDRAKDPLILSLKLDDNLQEHLTDLRERYFPKERNHLKGHITLFHALPAAHFDDIVDLLERTTAADSDSIGTGHLDQPSPWHIKTGKMVQRGSAVFVPLHSKRIESLHQELQNNLRDVVKAPLTQQDSRGNYWPHATVINKVDQGRADETFATLRSTGEAEKLVHGEVVGLDLWWYRGGPWEHIRTFSFRA